MNSTWKTTNLCYQEKHRLIVSSNMQPCMQLYKRFNAQTHLYSLRIYNYMLSFLLKCSLQQYTRSTTEYKLAYHRILIQWSFRTLQLISMAQANGRFPQRSVRVVYHRITCAHDSCLPVILMCLQQFSK